LDVSVNRTFFFYFEYINYILIHI